jgi:hypothetical protein
MTNPRPLTPKEKKAIKAKVHAVFARAIGVVAALIGVTAIALALWASYKVYPLQHRTAGFVLIGMFLVIGVFFLLVGWRLSLNRPNRFGSLLSPLGWRALGALFAAVGIGLSAFFVGTTTLTLNDVSIMAVPVIGSGVFAYWCFRAANKASANASAGAL